MPEIHLKELYMAKSLESLNKKVIIETNGNPMRLIKSAEVVLSKAKLSDKENDEELAYLYFMRYFGVVKAIQQHQDFIRNKKYYTGMLDVKCFKTVLHRAEELSKSLERRYKLLKDLHAVEEKEVIAGRKVNDKAKEWKIPSIDSTLSKNVENGLMSCEKLFSLTKEKVSSFLIIDIRPKEEFEYSSMKMPSVINIPQDTLKLGLTAEKSARVMDSENRALWNRRDTFDYIVICDYSFEESTLPPTIEILIDSMVKWDPGKNYRSTPVVLKGGYELFALKYPMLVTKPLNEEFTRKFAKKSHSLSTTETNSLLDFQYPDLNKTLIDLNSSGSLKPSVNRDLKPNFDVPEHSLDFASGSLTLSPTNVNSSQSLGPSAPTNVTSSQSLGPSAPTNVKSSQSLGPSPPKNVNSSQFQEPLVPNRNLKPQDLLNSLKTNKNDLQHATKDLEQSIKDEKEVLEKLEAIEETERVQSTSRDQSSHSQILKRKSELEKELDIKKNYVKEMEKKCVFWQKQHDEMMNLLSQVFSGQLKIDLPASDQENDEEKRKKLLEEVEIMRRKRKDKERAIAEEERKKEKDESEKLRWIEEKRNLKNRETASSNTSTKRGTNDTYTTKLASSPRSSPVRGGSNIKRSHSALNLSQLTDDNDSYESSALTPTFDRSLKPLNSPRRRNVNAARHRNFEPKYGSVAPTKTGLKNLGNTCYMNSILQCLSNTFVFAKYFLKGQYCEDINSTSKQNGEVADECCAVIRALWCGQYRSIAMWDLKSVVGRCHTPFLGYDQHDSHEFLIKLMDWLHEDLNQGILNGKKMEEQNHENISDFSAAQNVIDAMKDRDNSVIRDIFYGLHRSVIVCHTCHNRSVMFEPFSVLTLSFSSSSRKCSLKEMLNDYYRQSEIEYRCSKCEKLRNCTRKFDIWTMPPVIIIHLNRFEQDVLMKKKQSFVDFPLENLDFSYYTACPNRYVNFNLYGVSNHFGTIDGGHYTAYCKTPHKSWCKFDDHEVYDLPKESIRSSAAYILFYEASNLKSSL